MKHDKLVFIRIICLVGIIIKHLFTNSTGGILFGLILAITSVIFLLMLKNEMALEKSDCENNYSISIMCISVVVLLLIIVGYIILKDFQIITLSDTQEYFFSEILVFSFMALFGSCANALPFNKYVGLRLPWTLVDYQTWRYAHKLLHELTFPAILFSIVILKMFPNKSKTLMIWSVLLYLGVPSFFSYLYYKKKIDYRIRRILYDGTVFDDYSAAFYILGTLAFAKYLWKSE